MPNNINIGIGLRRWNYGNRNAPFIQRPSITEWLEDKVALDVEDTSSLESFSTFSELVKPDHEPVKTHVLNKQENVKREKNSI